MEPKANPLHWLSMADGSLAAVILALTALADIRRSKRQGAGLATMALILGVIATGEFAHQLLS
jgi:hypothetical protein